MVHERRTRPRGDGQGSGTRMSASPVSSARSRIGTTYVDRDDEQPARIVEPHGLGDPRASKDTEPSTFDRLLDLPGDMLQFGELLRELRNITTEAWERTLWVNDAGLQNAAGTAVTVASVQYVYGVGFAARVGSAVALRHLQVGSDTAGPVFLFATRGITYDPTGAGLRALGAVRLTTQCPTAYPAIEPLLDSGENLLMVLQAASGKLDFSCEYHALRSGK